MIYSINKWEYWISIAKAEKNRSKIKIHFILRSPSSSKSLKMHTINDLKFILQFKWIYRWESDLFLQKNDENVLVIK